jgi:hypothetical protein
MQIGDGDYHHTWAPYVAATRDHVDQEHGPTVP